jgi:2-polyprenyl-3-methyl-5-hydroxy-6-metoxy-1,4-benzoquinol methylase
LKASEKERLVKELYEKYPYPSRIIPTEKDVKHYAKWTAKIFDETISYWEGKEVLEMGCGTGELSVGLALCGAKVTAIDLSTNSIKKAKELSKKFNATEKTSFFEKNMLNIKENEFGKKFDVVIALGSMHHTTDAKKAFEIATKQLKENGFIIVGLYNKYSRVKHRIKRIFIKILAGNNIEKRIDIGEKLFGTSGKRIHSADKYGQVHESYHSVSEVKKWFKQNRITFVASKPKFKTPRIDELVWLLERKEAFFVMVGKKREERKKE